MDYPMLTEQDRVSSYRNSQAVAEGGKGNLTSGANPDIESLPRVPMPTMIGISTALLTESLRSLTV